MLRTSGEILIGTPTGYNSGSSVQRPITKKMIRRSILSMRSDRLIADTAAFSLFPTAQVGPFDAENNLERQRDGAEAHADEDCATDRGIEHVENPLRHISAERNQIFSQGDTAHHHDD